MKYRRTATFHEQLEQLPSEVRELVKEKFLLFRDNPKHPSLRIKKMQGHDDIWEGHITRDYVFTFHYENDDETGETIVVFRQIGTHSIYKKP